MEVGVHFQLTIPRKDFIFIRFSIMANIKSSIKDIRKTRTRTARNRSVRSEIKTLTKNFREAREGEDAEAKTKAARELVSALDKAAKRHIVHPNLARRHKANCAPYV